MYMEAVLAYFKVLLRCLTAQIDAIRTILDRTATCTSGALLFEPACSLRLFCMDEKFFLCHILYLDQSEVL
jgi:hypothetical protein